MSAPEELPLNDWQRAWKEGRTPKPPEDLSEAQRLYFEDAVKKIKFTPTAEGALEIDFTALSRAQMFAIGETGIPEWPFLPAIVEQTLRLSGLSGARSFAANPDARPLIDLERRKISGSLDHKEASALAGHLRGLSLSVSGANGRRTKGDETRDKVKRAALQVCSGISPDRIKRETVAADVAKLLGDKPKYGRILKLLYEIFPRDSWPPARE